MIIEPKSSKRETGEATRPRFRGLVRYMLRGKGEERCTWYMAENLPGLDRREDAETAIKVVEAYQRRNTRARSDKTYHMVISLHPDDRSLNEEELERVVRRAVAAAGLEEHPFIAARHSDQEHEHVHVAVSKIHPRTLKIHHPWKDIVRSKDLASELEQELGLHQVERSNDRERSVRSHASRDFEAARGEESFERWAQRTIGHALDLDGIGGWQELHARLAAYGVRLVPRGNGLALSDGTREGLRCKASALGRSWSKPRLTARYGEFAPGPSREQVARDSRERYETNPLGPLREDGLWREYQQVRAQARQLRVRAQEDFGRAFKGERNAQRSRFKLRHHMIQSLPIDNSDKRTLYKAMSVERAAADSLLRTKTKTRRAAMHVPRAPTWKEFLVERAENGDPRAVRRLARKRDRRTIGIQAHPRNTLPRGRPKTSRGTLMHDIGHGLRIRESPGLLELVGDPGPEGLAQLASFAQERFQGRRIRLIGNRAVTLQLDALIRERGLRITSDRERGR
ncbi:MAG: TraI/MobA(P) family conjugative relaxase [Polyangiales bacterium]